MSSHSESQLLLSTRLPSTENKKLCSPRSLCQRTTCESAYRLINPNLTYPVAEGYESCLLLRFSGKHYWLTKCAIITILIQVLENQGRTQIWFTVRKHPFTVTCKNYSTSKKGTISRYQALNLKVEMPTSFYKMSHILYLSFKGCGIKVLAEINILL